MVAVARINPTTEAGILQCRRSRSTRFNRIGPFVADHRQFPAQLDSEDIQLAGFVAPLTFDGDAITEFLLVPYFGACIHVPPPPANQTVMITLDEGESLTLDESWGAVWVAGKMRAATTNTDLATAGYSISGAEFGVYEPTESDGGAATADDVDSNREDDAAADVADIPVPLPPEADGATASKAGTFTVVEFTVPLDRRDATIEFYDAWTDAQPDEYERMEAENGAVSWQNAPEAGAVAIIIAVLAPLDGDDFVSVGVSTGGVE